MQSLVSYQKLYSFLLLAGLAGFVWLGMHLQKDRSNASDIYTVCLIKKTTGVPCPSCGNTRAMVAALQGNFAEAIALNPMGLLLLIMMVIAPIWVIRDLVTTQQSFYLFYKKMERVLSKKWVATPAIVLVLANWVWNIYKGI